VVQHSGILPATARFGPAWLSDHAPFAKALCQRICRGNAESCSIGRSNRLILHDRLQKTGEQAIDVANQWIVEILKALPCDQSGNACDDDHVVVQRC
jgi:hypothetical protein